MQIFSLKKAGSTEHLNAGILKYGQTDEIIASNEIDIGETDRPAGQIKTNFLSTRS